MSEGVFDITTGDHVTDDPQLDATQLTEIATGMEPVVDSLTALAADLATPDHDTV